MTTVRKRYLMLAALPLLAGALALGPARAQQTQTQQTQQTQQPQQTEQRRVPMTATGRATTPQDPAAEARQLVQDTAQVVERMKTDPELSTLLEQAKGILVIPNFVRGAFVVGGHGGQGVLVAREQGRWGGPVFYNVGGASIGLQVGAEAGEAAFLLMNDRTLEAFKREDTLTLDAEAGLTVADFSARARAEALQDHDVVAWSDMPGLFAGVSVGLRNITWNEDRTRAYYANQDVTPRAIIAGEVRQPEDPAPGTAAR